jgi:hypothetical protein
MMQYDVFAQHILHFFVSMDQSLGKIAKRILKRYGASD